MLRGPCGILGPKPGTEPGQSARCRVITTGVPDNPKMFYFKVNKSNLNANPIYEIIFYEYPLCSILIFIDEHIA